MAVDVVIELDATLLSGSLGSGVISVWGFDSSLFPSGVVSSGVVTQPVENMSSRDAPALAQVFPILPVWCFFLCGNLFPNFIG